MKNKCALMCLIALPCFALNALAISKYPTLDELCIDALHHNPQYFIKFSKAKISNDKLNESRAALLPQISTSAETGYESSDFAISNSMLPQYSIDPSHSHVYTYGVELKQAIFDDAFWQQFLSAKAMKQAAGFNLQAEKQQLFLNVAELYLKLLSLRQQQKVIKSEEALLSHQLKTAIFKKKHGRDTDLSIGEIKTKLQMIRAKLFANKASLAEAVNELADQVGVPVAGVRVLNNSYRPLLPQSMSVSWWQQQAFHHNWLLQAATAELKAAKHNVAKQSGENLPVVFLAMSYKKAKSQEPIYGQLKYSDSMIGVGVKFPIFSGGYHVSKTDQAIHQYQQGLYSYQYARMELGHAIMVTLNKLKTIKQKLNNDRTTLLVANRTVGIANRSFKLGLKDVSDVLQADNLWYKAQAEHQLNLYEFIALKLKLHQLSGRLNLHYIRTIASNFH